MLFGYVEIAGNEREIGHVSLDSFVTIAFVHQRRIYFIRFCELSRTSAFTEIGIA